MSKAFTRESDDLPDRPLPPRLSSPLPPGAKNYLTPDGARRLRDELESLTLVERPKLAALPPGDDLKQRLREVDQRILRLQENLRSAEIVPPPREGEHRVRFGAIIEVRPADGAIARYRIVGPSEIDLDRGWISCFSPLAKALLGGQAGQRIRFQFPSGEEVLEIISVSYPPATPAV
jgi:transcription elongation factor GreB